MKYWNFKMEILHFSIKPKHRQGSKSVLIKAQERNASAVYQARHRLLKLEDDEEELVKAEIPEAYKILPASSQLLSSLGKQYSTSNEFPSDSYGFCNRTASFQSLFKYKINFSHDFSEKISWNQIVFE